MLLFAYSYALDAMASSPKYPDRFDTERPLGTLVFPYNPAAPDAHRPAHGPGVQRPLRRWINGGVG